MTTIIVGQILSNASACDTGMIINDPLDLHYGRKDGWGLGLHGLASSSEVGSG